MQKITTFLMFAEEKHGRAEEAMNYYISLFKNSKIVQIIRYVAGEEGVEGTVKHAVFSLSGQELMAMDSNREHHFTFTPSISLFAQCEIEEEIDGLFKKLSDGGEVLMPLDNYPFSEKFGWVEDKFGVSWQLNLVKSQ
jgi:predicted 3-demethylubiquinone-9 3-methyltransferase (glyoxalase superfamily)